MRPCRHSETFVVDSMGEAPNETQDVSRAALFVFPVARSEPLAEPKPRRLNSEPTDRSSHRLVSVRKRLPILLHSIRQQAHPMRPLESPSPLDGRPTVPLN